VAVGPDDRRRFQTYWADEQLPFLGLPDPGHKVANRYKQQVKVFKWGRMPLVCIVARDGRIRYAHYGASMSDIPSNGELLDVTAELGDGST